MTPSTDLHQLVHALRPVEKRYLKLYAQRHATRTTPHTLQLLTAIETQTHYNETALKQQFANHPLGKHFAATKSRLFDLILAAMRAFNEDKHIVHKVRNLIADARFLRERRLYPLAQKRLQKAHKLAEHYHLRPELLEILHLKRREIKDHQRKGLAQQLQDNLTQTTQLLQKGLDEHQLDTWYQQVFIIARQDFSARNPDQKDRIATLLQAPLLKELPPQATFRSHIYFHQLHSMLAQLTHDWETSHQHKAQLVQLWESQPHLLHENIFEYGIALANLLAGQHMSGRYYEMPATIHQLRQIKTETEDQAAEIFSNRAFYQLLYYFNTGEFDAAAEGIEEIEEGLVKFSQKINTARKLTFYYNISLLQFLSDNTREALRWINKIIHDATSELRRDLQQSARLLLLIFHYELGNEDLLEYLFRSAHRYLYKQKNPGEFELLILEFLQRLNKTVDKTAREQAFSGLYEKMKRLKEKPKKSVAPGQNEVFLWLESKVLQQPIKAVAIRFARENSQQ